jgi:DNA-3-methyladenine glycosylase II
VLSLHQPEYQIEISPKKLADPTADPRKAKDKSKPTKSDKKSKGFSTSTEIDSDKEVEPEADELPNLNGVLPDASASQRLERALSQPPQKDSSSVLPAISTTKVDVLGTPLRRDKNPGAALATPTALSLPSMPPPLTPSITQVLSRSPDILPPPLPAGLTVASLKSRFDGKKKTKYVRN